MGVPVVAQQKQIQLVSMKMQVIEVGHRCSSDPELLWLFHRLAAVAPIRPLAWELPYATGSALRRLKTKRKRKNTTN